MKFSIKDFFGKCDQIRSFLRIWSYVLKKSLMENFIFLFNLCLCWGYNKSLKTLCCKAQNFQSEQAMTKQHHISLNSQFVFVLNGIICFSVRFCDNSLLVLKTRFQVFYISSKKVQGFSSDRRILKSLLSVLFHIQNHVSVFWNFNF